MRTTPPLTRNLEGLQVGAAARIAEIASYYPRLIPEDLLEKPDWKNTMAAHAEEAVEWAIQIIIAAEARAAAIPPTGAGVGPDMWGE